MAKKKADVAPEIADAAPKDTVTILLMDAHERDVVASLEVPPLRRERVYHHDDVAYEAARQEPDGSWVYRKVLI